MIKRVNTKRFDFDVNEKGKLCGFYKHKHINGKTYIQHEMRNDKQVGLMKRVGFDGFLRQAEVFKDNEVFGMIIFLNF